MNQKSLPEKVIDLTGGKIDLETAEVLIEKIQWGVQHHTNWMSCFPAINVARNHGLSRKQAIAVWDLVEYAMQREADAARDPEKRPIPKINISGRLQGYVLFNAAQDHEISQRLQKKG